MKISCDESSSRTGRYVPLALGNGELSLQVDYTGAMEQAAYCRMTPGIVRAGIRYDRPKFPLVPFGYFTQELTAGAEITGWKQEFDVDSALCECRTVYGGGLTMVSQIFCHLRHNLLVIRKRFLGEEYRGYRFRFHFGAPRMQVEATPELKLNYRIETFRPETGCVVLTADRPVRREIAGNGEYLLSTEEREVVIFLAFDQEAAELAASCTYEQLLSSHREAWQEFWNESTLDVPAGRLGEATRMAEYLLRISTTRWSVPTGLFHEHWEGRYFAFDEFFSLLGLLATGHLSLAKRIPAFRFDSLAAARERAYSYFGSPSRAARYVWEAIEQPGLEGCPPGFWQEHIFHMAHIALSAWHYWCAAGDRDFLERTGYPVMSACAEFYRCHATIETGDGRLVIGKCTDLERLGPARENPFMTSCGAIAALEAAAEAAEELKTDPETAALWRECADRLRASLPADETRYLPYHNCTETGSIALLSGIFPYGVLPAEDPRQLAAIADYCSREAACGNMYPVGRSVCSWYAAWKAIVFCRLSRPGEARSILEQMAEETGCFAEMFEIYETGHHPWFTTAAGTFLTALGELAAAEKQNTPETHRSAS